MYFTFIKNWIAQQGGTSTQSSETSTQSRETSTQSCYRLVPKVVRERLVPKAVRMGDHSDSEHDMDDFDKMYDSVQVTQGSFCLLSFGIYINILFIVLLLKILFASRWVLRDKTMDDEFTS